MAKRGYTDAYFKSLKPGKKGDGTAALQTDYPDDKQSGLILRVSAKARVWTYRYRSPLDLQQRRMTYGKFPDIGVSDARKWAEKNARLVADGRDPLREKKEEQEREARKGIKTVADLAEAYEEAAAVGRHKAKAARPKRQSTLDMERYYYDRFIKSALGKLRIEEVSRTDVQSLLDKAAKDSGASSARQCLAILRQMFNFAIRRELAAKNPAQFGGVANAVHRDRVLSDAEMKAIWQAAENPHAIEGLQVSPLLGLAIRFAMLTLQRGGEVCGLHTDEMDLSTKTWTIPGARTKNHKSHVVPLSDAAVCIINEALQIPEREVEKATKSKVAKGRHVFGSPRADAPITRHALSRATRRLCDKIGIEDATPHDFRRTGSTNLTGEGLGFPRFIVSRVLNHISDTGGAAAITGVYDRNLYLPEKRRALDAWATRLHEIVTGTAQSDNVVPMKGRA